jgi:hypothetical protein
MIKKVLLATAIACFSFVLHAQNLLTNGNFESGNLVGFQSDYNFINVGAGQANSVQRQYTIVSNSQFLNTTNYIVSNDHTSGTGLMMVCDGANTQEIFWKTNGDVVLQGGTNYTFKFWVRAVNNTNPQTQIGFRVMQGGTNTFAGNYTVLAPSSGWQEKIFNFTVSGTGNQYRRLELFNITTGLTGNDFAIDDLSLTPPSLPLQVTASATPISCNATNNGSITVYGLNGITPYINYTISGPISTSNNTGLFTNLPAGTYSVSVTDSNNTTVNQSNIVVGNVNLGIQSSTTYLCQGSSVTLSPINATNVTWSANPIDATLTNPNNTTISVSPTITTTYTVTNNSPIASQNLIANGNFSQGNVGFISDYQFMASNPTGFQKSYGVVTNPNTWLSGLVACTDHTSGLGNMMVVDGSTVNNGNDKIWCQTVTVIPNTLYTFTYWVQSVSGVSPAQIETTINGVNVGLHTATSTTCSWQMVTYNWNSGTSTTAQICLFDQNVSVNGNDFALDDISFTYQNNCNNTANFTVNVVNTPVTPLFTPIANICNGTVLSPLPTTSLNNITGTWSPALNNATSTTYTFTPTPGQCATTNTLTIGVNILNVPMGITTTGITPTQATASWTINGTPSATIWEVRLLPASSPAPLNTDTIIPTNTVTTNSRTFTGLSGCTQYIYYVRAVCYNGVGTSNWATSATFTTLVSNDECSTATNVPVNSGILCALTAQGCLTGATASSQANACAVGDDNDDVWFKFVATATNLMVSMNNIVGTTTNLSFVVYSGNCNSLVTHLSPNPPGAPLQCYVNSSSINRYLSNINN